jgi:ribosome-binding factor A
MKCHRIIFMARRNHRDNTPGPAGPSQRALRAGELVRHAIAEVLQRGDVHDPVLAGHLITIPEVRMSPDLRQATVYVMPLGGRDTKEVLDALERNKKFLRTEVAHRVNLKFAPEIKFRFDDRFDEAERIEKLLRTPAVKRDLDQDRDE